MEHLKTLPKVGDALESIYNGLIHAPSPTTIVPGTTVLQGCLPLLMEEIPADELIQRVGQKKYEQWRLFYKEMTLLNLWFRLEMKLVLETICEANIPVMVLKGADLADNIYPASGSRHFSDVDLMVRPQHLADTFAVLERLGFTYHQEYRFETISRKRAAFVYVKEVQAGFVVVEVHTSPHSNEMGVSFDVAKIWERTRSIVVAGVPVQGMGLEDLLLYLCWHYRSHAFTYLIWLYDIAILLSDCGDRLDWTLVHDLARKQGLLSTLYYCLRWSEQVLHIPAPEHAQLERFTPPAFIQRLVAHYVGEDFVPALNRKAYREKKLLQRIMVDDLKQLSVVLLRVVFPSPTHLGRFYMEKYQTPVRFYWLYYPLHPLFLLRSLFGRSSKAKNLRLPQP